MAATPLLRRPASSPFPILAALAVLVAAAAPAQAGGGELDPTFGGDGKVTTAVRDWRSYATDVAVQADGKIVAAGWATGRFGLVRYEPDGDLDPSFGGDGKVTTEFTSGFDWANGVALQPDGKIVAVGTANWRQFAVARYRPNGTLDPTFSDDGKATANFNGGEFEEVAEGVVVQPDRKIVAAGYADLGAYRFALARFRPGGRLDPSFGRDGRVTTSFPPRGGDMTLDVALQLDGRIVAAGTANFGSFAVARYLPDGSRDDTFGPDGRVKTNVGDGIEVANGVALQGDGKIVLAGESGSPYFTISGGAGASDQAGRFALTRYGPDGVLDPGFGGDGIVTTNFTRRIDAARAVAIQPDGKIVAAGVAGEAEAHAFDSRFALARYETSGARDASFGGDGKVTTDFFDSFDTAYAVAIQTDGKIVAAGRTARSGINRFALARYTSA